MKYAHSIKLSFFSYEDEDKKSVLEAFLRFFPFNLDDNKLALNKTSAAAFPKKKETALNMINDLFGK